MGRPVGVAPGPQDADTALPTVLIMPLVGVTMKVHSGDKHLTGCGLAAEEGGLTCGRKGQTGVPES